MLCGSRSLSCSQLQQSLMDCGLTVAFSCPRRSRPFSAASKCQNADDLVERHTARVSWNAVLGASFDHPPPEHPPPRLLLPTLTGTRFASADWNAARGRGSLPTTLPNPHPPRLTRTAFVCHRQPHQIVQPAFASIDWNDVGEPARFRSMLPSATSLPQSNGSARHRIYC